MKRNDTAEDVLRGGLDDILNYSALMMLAPEKATIEDWKSIVNIARTALRDADMAKRAARE